MQHIQLQPRLVDQVYGQILDAICSGALAPGARVVQDELAERLNVSRQPVLQALLLLKRQGFLCTAGRRGLMVAPIDPAATMHLYELRIVLDGVAARGAATRRSRDAAARGAALIEAGRRAVARGDTGAMIAADMAFHGFVYELCGNPLIVETAGLHWQHIRRVMGQYLQGPVKLGGIWDEHAAILDAVADGRAEAAEWLSRRHAEEAARMLLARIEAAGALKEAG